MQKAGSASGSERGRTESVPDGEDWNFVLISVSFRGEFSWHGPRGEGRQPDGATFVSIRDTGTGPSEFLKYLRFRVARLQETALGLLEPSASVCFIPADAAPGNSGRLYRKFFARENERCETDGVIFVETRVCSPLFEGIDLLEVSSLFLLLDWQLSDVSAMGYSAEVSEIFYWRCEDCVRVGVVFLLELLEVQKRLEFVYERGCDQKNCVSICIYRFKSYSWIYH